MLTKRFPPEEKYSLVDQVRRSSRSVAANVAEAWRRRRYEASFVNKLNTAEAEATETQTWIEFARRCGYLSPDECGNLDGCYDRIVGQLVNMMRDAKNWVLVDVPLPRTPK